MSLSTPTTSMPRPAKCRTDSEPIRPAEPVTTTTLLIKDLREICIGTGPRLPGVRTLGDVRARVHRAMLGSCGRAAGASPDGRDRDGHGGEHAPTADRLRPETDRKTS